MVVAPEALKVLDAIGRRHDHARRVGRDADRAVGAKGRHAVPTRAEGAGVGDGDGAGGGIASYTHAAGADAVSGGLDHARLTGQRLDGDRALGAVGEDAVAAGVDLHAVADVRRPRDVDGVDAVAEGGDRGGVGDVDLGSIVLDIDAIAADRHHDPVGPGAPISPAVTMVVGPDVLLVRMPSPLVALITLVASVVMLIVPRLLSATMPVLPALICPALAMSMVPWVLSAKMPLPPARISLVPPVVMLIVPWSLTALMPSRPAAIRPSLAMVVVANRL